MTLSMSALFWVTTGTQYWFSDYLITEIKMPKDTVFVSYSLVIVTASIAGVLGGGKLASCLGGFNSVKLFWALIIMASGAFIFAIPIPFLNKPEIILTCLWFLLFLGAAILPGLSGM